MTDLDPRVTALAAMKTNGNYFAPRGPMIGDQPGRNASLNRIIRQALSGVGEPLEGDIALIEGYDDEGDLVAEYGIRHERAFKFLYRKLGWRTA